MGRGGWESEGMAGWEGVEGKRGEGIDGKVEVWKFWEGAVCTSWRIAIMEEEKKLTSFLITCLGT